MGLLDFEGLGHVNVVADLNPVLYPILYDLLFLLTGHLPMLLQSQNRVLLLQHGVGRRIQAIKGVLLEWRAVDSLGAACLA